MLHYDNVSIAPPVLDAPPGETVRRITEEDFWRIISLAGRRAPSAHAFRFDRKRATASSSPQRWGELAVADRSYRVDEVSAIRGWGGSSFWRRLWGAGSIELDDAPTGTE